MRVRVVGLIAAAVAVAVLAVLLALAGNAATAQSRWPGPLDWLRQEPWLWVGLLGPLSAALAGIAVRLQEHQPAGRDDPPPPPPPPVPGWFVDRAQTRDAVAAVGHGGSTVAVTTSLVGAGGFGKTTLATAVCADRRVRRRFRTRIYFVTIGRDVRGRAAVAAKVAAVTRFVTGDGTEFDDPDLAGAHLGRLLDQRPRTLLVLDDVWEPEQLAPFLHGGKRLVRLVTTRNPALLAHGVRHIPVDDLSPAQARSLLTWQLPPLSDSVVVSLLQATRRWALLVRLSNRVIAEQVATGSDAADAAGRLLRRLREHGPAAVDDASAAWDLADPAQRNQAARASIEAATSLLPPGGSDRYLELGVFAEDEAVPISLVATLWEATAGLAEHESRSLCRSLERLSLLTLTPEHGGRISLHDVYRDYLRTTLGPARLARANRLLLDTLATTLPAAPPLTPSGPDPQRAWWQHSEPYLLDNLIHHLLDADRTAAAEALAGDIRWVETRLHQRGSSAPWSDLDRIDTPHTRPLARSLAQAAHLLTPTTPPRVLTGILHSRLDHHPHWHPQIAARQHDSALRPSLTNQWPLPDNPHSALQRTLTGHTSWVRSVAIAPDGTWLATAGNDAKVRIWDRASGSCTATLTGHTGIVSSVAIAPDGTWLATAGDDKTVRVWDRATGLCTATLTGRTDWVRSVAIAPDGTWFATAGNDAKVRIWDCASWSCIATFTGHTDWVRSVAIAPDGTWFATAGKDETVRVWDRATGSCIATFTGHTDWVRSVAIAPDGTWFATAGDDGTVRVWDRATGAHSATLTGHTAGVSSVAIAPDGAWFATAGDDKTVRVWDRATGLCTATFTDHTDWVRSVAIAPDGTWFATAGDDKTARIWDRLQPASNLPSLDLTREVNSVAIAPDGTWLATAGDDETVRVWDRASGSCIATFTGHTGWVRSVAIAPDGTWLATAGDDKTARIWDRASGSCIATFTGHTGKVNSVAIAPDGTWLATAGNDGTVRVWDRATGSCTATLTGHTRGVSSVAIAPDGAWFATAGNDEAVRVWDCATGSCTATLTDHTDWVRSVAIAPDGTWFATAGNDGTVRVWDCASWSCIATFTGHTDWVRSVAIAPDGTWLATAGNDETVRIWDVTSQQFVSLMRTEGPPSSCAWGASASELAVGGARGLYVLAFRP
ncbi:hypothetical protein HUT15_37100 (plasmid) [Streptomyces sp. NA03103]|uniref:NB-ARC domain-containing protein n=1 Tax=Streptomyces sp. NA03103 TaxID=2742134 RepID=UPI0015918011|nr:NB-ARC domain-containing protein [Streptomyces sp. NA03103]QKW66134.1 hypothetical protein HUT15_37100 [Streptomyces sp. NA03103]